jgi:hypothetical protein
MTDSLAAIESADTTALAGTVTKTFFNPAHTSSFMTLSNTNLTATLAGPPPASGILAALEAADTASMTDVVVSAGFTLVAHTNTHKENGPVTTGSINTTGANLLVVAVTQYRSGIDIGNLSDSKGNTWIGLTAQTASTELYVRLYYCASPSVGSAHTFSYSNGAGNTIYGGIAVQAWNGANASPFVAENGDGHLAGGHGSIQPGAVTPAQNHSLIITVCGPKIFAAPDITIDGGYIVSDGNAGDDVGNGIAEPIYMAYLLQATAAATNPTWSWTGATAAGAVIAVFKP